MGSGAGRLCTIFCIMRWMASLISRASAIAAGYFIPRRRTVETKSLICITTCACGSGCPSCGEIGGPPGPAPCWEGPCESGVESGSEGVKRLAQLLSHALLHALAFVHVALGAESRLAFSFFRHSPASLNFDCGATHRLSHPLFQPTLLLGDLRTESRIVTGFQGVWATSRRACDRGPFCPFYRDWRPVRNRSCRILLSPKRKKPRTREWASFHSHVRGFRLQRADLRVNLFGKNPSTTSKANVLLWFVPCQVNLAAFLYFCRRWRSAAPEINSHDTLKALVAHLPQYVGDFFKRTHREATLAHDFCLC